MFVAFIIHFVFISKCLNIDREEIKWTWTKLIVSDDNNGDSQSDQVYNSTR